MRHHLKNLARTLRKNQTLQEIKLWYLLKNRNFNGCKFRRQFPIGNYIVDFICFEKRFIIELDGSQHFEDNAINYDKKRDNFLKEQGFKIFRIGNTEINTNIDGVYQAIYYQLNDPSPAPATAGAPSPARGEG